jgi:hypothetical protein
MRNRLVETTGVKKGKGNVWRSRLISAGTGSSAHYPADVLKEYGPAALAKGTQIFLDHPTENEELERGGGRSIKDYAGVIMADPEWVEEEQALYAPIKYIDNVVPLVEGAFEDIALSIDVRKFELSEAEVDGKPVVSKMFAHPLNNVAIVPRGGRDGKIVSLIESYRDSNANPDTISANTESLERNPMTPEEIKALSEAIVAALTPALKEALTPAPAGDDEKTEGIDLAAVVESATDAGLPKVARTRIVEALKANPTATQADATALIEAEKTYVDGLKESVTAEVTGTLRESAGTTTDLKIGAWA